MAVGTKSFIKRFYKCISWIGKRKQTLNYDGKYFVPAGDKILLLESEVKTFLNFMCKHLIAILAKLRLEGCVIQLLAKSVPLGQKRKRDAPVKAKKALILH